MFERKERFGPEKKILLVVALAILIASVSTFAILYWMMNAALQEDIRSRAQVVNAYSEDNINVYSFTHINGPEDGRRDTYAEVRAMLENIRQIANVRYLYTAKLDASGRPVYLVDGLPPDSPDFRHPGDFIEEDIVPMLKKCLSGKSIESDGVLNTEWGAIYLTCRPVYANGEERPLGAVVMEFNADAVYANNMRSMLYSGILCLLLVGACIVSTMFWLRRLAAPFYKKLAYTDMLTGLGNRTAFELRLRELEKETGRRNFIMVIYDLNEMKKVTPTAMRWGMPTSSVWAPCSCARAPSTGVGPTASGETSLWSFSRMRTKRACATNWNASRKPARPRKSAASPSPLPTASPPTPGKSTAPPCTIP